MTFWLLSSKSPIAKVYSSKFENNFLITRIGKIEKLKFWLVEIIWSDFKILFIFLNWKKFSLNIGNFDIGLSVYSSYINSSRDHDFQGYLSKYFATSKKKGSTKPFNNISSAVLMVDITEKL